MQELSGHAQSFSSRRSSPPAAAVDAHQQQGHKNATLPESDLLDPAQIFQILRRRARLISYVTLIGCALAVAYILVAKPTYTASASIFIDTRQQKVFAADAVLPGLSSDASVIESQVEILRSPNIARRAIEALGLSPVDDKPAGAEADAAAGATSPTAAGAPAGAAPTAAADAPAAAPTAAADAPAGAAPGSPGGDPSNIVGDTEARADAAADVKSKSEFVSTFLKNLEVNRIGLTYIISVNYSDEDPLQAVKVANAVANAYIADQTEAKYEATRLANRWLYARIGELRTEVRAGEERVQTYKADHNLIEIGGQNLIEREVAEYMQQLIAARAKMAEADAQLQIDQTRSRITETSSNAYELAKTKVILLEKGLEALKLELAKRDQLAIQLSELQRELDATSGLYATLLKRHKETQAQESLQTPDVRIVSYALQPTTPSKPNKKLVLGLAGATSLGLGVMLALVLEFSQGVFRLPKDLAHVPGLTWLASLPVIGSEPSPDGGARIGSKAKPVKRGRSQTRLWHVLDDEGSQYSQAIFSILHTISITDSATRPIVIAVVSADKNDGKTTVAANLAHYAAASGARTLLIDCDLRNPDLTAALSPNPALSIVDIIADNVDPAQVIVSDPRSGASFCPGPHGKRVVRPMNVTGSPQMASFLQDMRTVFDIAIVDTSPLRPYVDARTLIDEADFVLVVVGWGKTKTEHVRTALQESHLPGNKSIGAVINQVET